MNLKSLKYIFTNLSMVFRLYVKLSKAQFTCSDIDYLIMSQIRLPTIECYDASYLFRGFLSKLIIIAALSTMLDNLFQLRDLFEKN